ncbi:EpsG family protein [Candidatus Galacturonibacter soehngenii]|uniref:EpsG family protein n=1 Tax=Candidatus Galacturonatibacter soehngenii TaxID=2307010 RepID=A0A7V7UBR7_9FIRM|nr:EpsG family protein [Candidatus Galacturonibacter soehngenii]KAB1438245.1 EpsG family protein [Candidatus Galacturonibacter soehngenii]
MSIYLLVVTLTTGLGYLYQHVKKEQKKIIFFLLVLVPSIVAGLRTVGTDYFGYMQRYQLVQDGIKIDSIGTNLTVTFYKLMKLNDVLGGSYQTFIFIIAFITIYIAFYLICKLEEYICIPMAIFSYMTMFYLMSFNIFRQVLAAEIFALAIYYFILANKKLFLLFISLSILIHSSVFIYLAVFFAMPLIQMKKFRYIRLWIYAILLAMVFSLPMIPKFGYYIADRFSHYAYYFMHFHYQGIGLGFLRYIILVLLPIICILVSKRRNHKIDKILNVYFFLTIIGTILWMISYVSTTFLYRSAYVGLIVLPSLHGYITKSVKKTYLRIGVTIILVCVLSFFCWYDYIYLNSGEVRNYSCFLYN